MLFIILGIIIGLIYNHVTEDYEAFLNGFIGALIGLIVYVIGGLIIGASLPKNEVITKQEICALKDGNEIEGSYFLFSGYIDEKMTYEFVVNTDRGKHVESLNENNDIYIKEGDYKPSVEYHNYVFKSNWFYWFAININCFDNYTTFYVPTDTVTNEYNIDLD